MKVVYATQATTDAENKEMVTSAELTIGHEIVAVFSCMPDGDFVSGVCQFLNKRYPGWQRGAKHPEAIKSRKTLLDLLQAAAKTQAVDPGTIISFFSRYPRAQLLSQRYLPGSHPAM